MTYVFDDLGLYLAESLLVPGVDEKGAIEKNLNALLDILDDLFFVLNKDGCVLHFNPFMQLRLGYAQKELHQRKFSDLCPKHMQEDVRKKLDQIWHEESGTLDIALSSKYGVDVPVEVKLTTGEWNAQKVLFAISRNTAKQCRI